jgi:hypothetical protein
MAERPPVSQEAREKLLFAARVQVARLAIANGDILLWGKACFPEKFQLPFCKELHEYMASIRGDQQTSTEAPRNHAKTTISCFLIPIYQALNEPKSFRYYLNIQGTDTKALAVNTSIKLEIEENKVLRELYGNQVGVKWTDAQFELVNGVVFTSRSAGQSLRGIMYRSRRPDYLIIDDLYDEEDLNNPDSTVKKNSWFWSTLYPCRAKSRRWAIHVQGTAINNEDILQELKKKKGWTCRSFSACADLVTGPVLWPELNTLESLNKDLENMGSVIFYREMMNQRMDETTSIVKRSWLYPSDGRQSWEFDPATLKFDEHKVYQGAWLGFDPSIGSKSENDFCGIALVWKQGWDDGKGSRFYIMGLWQEHWSQDERVMFTQRLWDDQPNERKFTARIEAIAGFKDFCAEVQRRTTVPVEEVDMVKDKITTLVNKSHFFENRRVFINKNIEPKLKDALVHQLTVNHPKHDDLRDGLQLVLDDGVQNWGSFV